MTTQSEIRIHLPRPHSGQIPILASTARFRVVNCGRRWGKTVYGIHRAAGPALEGWPVGWWAPKYKYLGEAWRDFKRVLKPVIASANATEKRIELITGGSLEFWTLNDADSGRSRKYKRVIIDEAGRSPYLESCWTESIRPTLTDFQGDADFTSTPKGRNFFWKAYTWGQDEFEPDWASWKLPTVTNPTIPGLAAEVEAARRKLPELVFAQEFEAEFIEDAGTVFRKVKECTDAGRCQPEPPRGVGGYLLGVDLARVNDFTVLCVLDGMGRQVYFERFNQISWERQIASIKAVAKRYEAKVVVDSTGVGDPIFERLQLAGLNVEGYHINGASKPALIDFLAMRLEQGLLRLMDLPEQTAELLAYEYELTKGRTLRTNAPEGMHDDCVIALALAAWGSAGNGGTVGGYYSAGAF